MFLFRCTVICIHTLVSIIKNTIQYKIKCITHCGNAIITQSHSSLWSHNAGSHTMFSQHGDNMHVYVYVYV